MSLGVSLLRDVAGPSTKRFVEFEKLCRLATKEQLMYYQGIVNFSYPYHKTRRIYTQHNVTITPSRGTTEALIKAKEPNLDLYIDFS